MHSAAVSHRVSADILLYLEICHKTMQLKPSNKFIIKIALSLYSMYQILGMETALTSV